ncbi:hypothetical protein JW988_06240 [Candidatus Bathyarchaeota archaeon]|nr:hypothetical protein [Candidatus Bathyarchaeota archaeon]
MFFWLDTVSPLGPQQANVASIVGAVNSCLTLLIAGIITSAACLILYQKRKVDTRLVGISLILLGSYFIIYDLVSIWVNVYRDYLYLTDFWMAVLPILGISALKTNPFNTTAKEVKASTKKQFALLFSHPKNPENLNIFFVVLLTVIKCQSLYMFMKM